MLQRCNEVRLRILYPLDECTVYDLFAIKRRHIMLQQQSQPLSMVIASVSSTQASHSCKARSTFYFSDAVTLEQLPESNSSPFYTQV